MISNFEKKYAPRYQDILNKALVGKEFASFRLESQLTQGESITRFKLDLSGVQVRTITPLVDRTIDPVANSTQLLEITEYKGTTFPISQWEKTLKGNPNLGEEVGKEVAIKVQEYLDADIFAELQNAANTFDTGDLTSTASNGTPINLSTTNVPQLVTMAPAKLRNHGVRSGTKVWVFDDYALAIVGQHLIGKDIEMAGTYLQNGKAGKLVNAKVLVSDNLTGQVVAAIGTQPTAGQVFTIAGVTFEFVASPATAGQVDIGSDVDESRANLEAAINGGAGAGTAYIEVSAANRATLDRLRLTATNDDTANTLTVIGVGAGRIAVSTDIGSATTSSFIHAGYGVKGAVDVVVQEEVDMKMLQESKQDTMNILNDLIYGIKTFDDGADKMLDIHIQA